MITFFKENIGNILVLGVIVPLAIWVIVRYFKQKALGGAACSGCPGCASCSSCLLASRKEGRS